MWHFIWVFTVRGFQYTERVNNWSLVITFANSLEPDQARQYVGSDLEPTCLTLLKDFFENVNFEKIRRRQKIMKKFPSSKEFQETMFIN